MKFSKYLLALIALCCIPFTSSAEEAKEPETPTSFVFSVAQDPAFGFYPSIWGSIGINDKTALTFYGVYWTSPTTGNNLSAQTIGLDLLTEFGVGVNFTMMDGALNINPSIGLANGRYQSGANRPVVGDNIVPNVTVSYASGNLSLTAGAIAWLAFRNEGPAKINMFDYNISPMYQLTKHFSAGLYADLLMFEYKNTDPTLDDARGSYPYYMWLGPSMKFTIKNVTTTFSFGADLVDYLNSHVATDDKKVKDFYKLSTSIAF